MNINFTLCLSPGCKRAAVDQLGHTSPNEFHLPWTFMEDPATALTEVKVTFFQFLEKMSSKAHLVFVETLVVTFCHRFLI